MKRKLLYFVVILIAILATLFALFNPLNPGKSAAKADYTEANSGFDIQNLIENVIGR
jgi:dolichyl-phosphate-mannose--protein O-mannosyl transferase